MVIRGMMVMVWGGGTAGELLQKFPRARLKLFELGDGWLS